MQITRQAIWSNCFDGYLSYRYLPFHIEVTFVLDAMLIESLISSTFGEQYIIVYRLFPPKDIKIDNATTRKMPEVKRL